jgi:hypothetical protein
MKMKINEMKINTLIGSDDAQRELEDLLAVEICTNIRVFTGLVVFKGAIEHCSGRTSCSSTERTMLYTFRVTVGGV